MRFGRRHLIVWATGAAIACLLGVMTARVSARQAASAQAPLMSENLFRNIEVLKGIPVDTFFDVMGMFASSMGEDCTFCHSKESGITRLCLL